MSLLLDTHIWLWSLLEPSRLGRRVRTALVADGAEIWLSPISVWEALVLAETGRVELRPDPATWVRDAMAVAPMLEAPLSFDIAVESRQLVLPHRDPADRFLAATAKVLDLTLVTSDRRLLAGRGYATLSNN
jgi:PIN domain nuclease of toxin-antitoxin system